MSGKLAHPSRTIGALMFGWCFAGRPRMDWFTSFGAVLSRESVSLTTCWRRPPEREVGEVFLSVGRTLLAELNGAAMLGWGG
jgi:hypothetical protein